MAQVPVEKGECASNTSLLTVRYRPLRNIFYFVGGLPEPIVNQELATLSIFGGHPIDSLSDGPQRPRTDSVSFRKDT